MVYNGIFEIVETTNKLAAVLSYGISDILAQHT